MGLSCIRDRKVVQVITEKEGLSSNRVNCLLYGLDDTLWIGTSKGLDVLKDGKVSHYVTKGGFREGFFAVLGIYRGTVVAAIRSKGVFQCVNGSLIRLDNSVEADLKGISTCAFYADESGNLWMGTQREGLLVFDGTRTIAFTAKDGLFDDDVYEIIPDAKDRLWMACSKGVFSVAKTDLIRLAKRQLTTINCLPFAFTEQSRTVECQPISMPTAYRTKDGRIWFSTIHGIIVIDPNNIQRTVPPPQVVVEDIEVQRKS